MASKIPKVGLPPDFSLVLGGPLYQLFLRTRLAKPGVVELVNRRAIVVILITWLPLLILTIFSGNAWKGVGVPFLFDLDVQARFLIALPMLVITELIVHQRVRFILEQFIYRDIIPETEKSRFQSIIESTMRLRNSLWIELLLLVSVFSLGHWIWKDYISLKVTTWYVFSIADKIEFTTAGYWYAFVSIPVFQFILLRWYFRLALWYRFLWKTSRLKLNLIAIHPDNAGGMGFLGDSIDAFILILLAHTVLLSGIIANHIWHEAAQLTDYKLEIFGTIIFLLLLVLIPLSFFMMKFWKTKQMGLREFGDFATRYVDDFNQKWFQGSVPERESSLGSSDIQSLADLANSYSVAREMNLFPFHKSNLIRATVILIIPFLPLDLTMISMDKIIEKFLGIVF